MPTPALPDAERQRRKDAIEELVNQGFAPPGVRDGRPSACQELKKRENTNFPRWILDERRRQAKGERHFLPNFIGEEDGHEEVTLTASGEEVATAHDHAGVRARTLAGEIRSLVTGSRWPLSNPEAIVVDGFVSKRYDTKAGEYRFKEGTPRTYVSDTLRVAPITDCRNRKFILTCAQNDTAVHEPFWNNLKAYADHLEAEIAVAGATYCSSWWDENNPTARSYDDAISDYLCFGQLAIGDDFVFCADVNIIPTASQPVTDLVTYPRNRNAVFPHPKRQLKSVPSTDPDIPAKQVCTTGSVTRPKLIPRKAGAKALFHSVIGAVIVEFDEDGAFFMRQITADESGAFYDLDVYVSDGSITRGHAVEAIVCADIHTRKLDTNNSLATFGFSLDSDIRYVNSLIETLRPGHLFLHDIFDHEARNHHHVGDVGYAYEMHVRGRDSVLSEIVQVGDLIERLCAPERKLVVVESNHDIGLTRFVAEGRYRHDPPNLRIGLKLEEMLLTHRAHVATELDAKRKPRRFSLLEEALKLSGVNMTGVTWAYDGYSYVLGSIECGHHGFRGVNGSKGTVQGFSRTGRKLSIADKHSPEINEGVYVAGAMNLNMFYNKGPSTWGVSHILHYRDGSRTLVTLNNGRWCADQKPILRVPAKAA